jgi:hypothetical protein
MTISRVSLSLVGIVGALAATLAGATIWLILTQPVTTAENINQAISQGEVSPFVRALGNVLYDALKGILKYL